MAQSKSGTFTGDGTITVTLDIGFEPDVIVIDSGRDYFTSGWTGIGMVIIVKGKLAINYFHINDTATTYSRYETVIATGGDPYGADGGSNRSYGLYNNGEMTVTNKTNRNSYKYISGQSYSWTAYKA